jgi:hypothetical protein
LYVPASSSAVLLGCIAWLIQPLVASGNSRFVGFCYDGLLSDSEAGQPNRRTPVFLGDRAGAALAQEDARRAGGSSPFRSQKRECVWNTNSPAQTERSGK